jgi:FkbM family methyltransferase
MPMVWRKIKDAAIRAGIDDALRPLADRLRGRKPDQDDEAAFALIARLPKDAVCVDVGCHKGKFLDPMRRAAPGGRFFAFEPIPYLFDMLKSKYRADERVRLFNCALSSVEGVATFFVNERDMGLSGLNARPDRMGADRLTEVKTTLLTLDGVVGEQKIDFIKIDVEGAELDVLRGGARLIARDRPTILFEFGLGGAEYFGADADAMFSHFAALDYRLYTVADRVAGGVAVSAAAFRECYARNSAYNFVAAPGAADAPAPL